MRVGFLIETVTHLSLAVTTSSIVALSTMVVFGAHEFVWGTISETVRQRAVPDEILGRVTGVYRVANVADWSSVRRSAGSSPPSTDRGPVLVRVLRFGADRPVRLAATRRHRPGRRRTGTRIGAAWPPGRTSRSFAAKASGSPAWPYSPPRKPPWPLGKGTTEVPEPLGAATAARAASSTVGLDTGRQHDRVDAARSASKSGSKCVLEACSDRATHRSASRRPSSASRTWRGPAAGALANSAVIGPRWLTAG